MNFAKNFLLLFLLVASFNLVVAQEKDKEKKKDDVVLFGKKELLKTHADNACKCIDSIETANKPLELVNEEIADCIDKEVMVYQLIDKMSPLVNDAIKETETDKPAKTDKPTEKETDTVVTNQTIDIVIGEKGTDVYDKYYYRIENYLMENCPSLKTITASNDELMQYGISDDPKAQEYYSKGQKASQAENYKKAIKYYKKAIEIDPNFPYALDNLGLTYRKTGQYNKALEAYAKSIELLPNNKTPVMNSAVVYIHMKRWDKAIEMYKKLIEIDETDPEVYYGIGQVLMQKGDYEEALDNMCKAYNIYIDKNSPYRSDAEKVINFLYLQLKKDGKEDKFIEILKKNNINVSEEE